MSGAPLLELVDVAKTFMTGDVEVRALRGVTLSIRHGEFVAIMGASGSGKSTLMNILGCLDRPTAGHYRVAGQDVDDLDGDELAALRRSLFGFIFQSYNLIATASATENVEIPAIYAGLSAAEREKRAVDILAALGLGDRLDHRPNQLSGGQQQRVSIARAIMNGGQVILADEPTGALDSRSGAEVMALLHALHRAGHTIILITHDRETAKHAERLIELKDGVVIADVGARPATHERAAKAPRIDHARLPWLAGASEATKMALRALRANVFRTILTLLGIVIGVGSVVAMLAVGDGAKESVLRRISAMGTNLLLIRPSAPNQRGSAGITTLVPADAIEIAKLDNVIAAVPELTGGVTVRHANIDYQTQANATTPDLVVARDWTIARGSFVTDADVESYAPIAVLGQTVVDVLFGPDIDPVGRYILINNVSFQVVGVLGAKGATPFGADQDDVVFVPISTGSLRLFGIRHVRNITVLVEELSQMEATQDAIATLLRQRHRANDFQIRNMAAIIETATQTQSTLTILLGSIAAISLLVGGIGVMNIMLVSVTERTREIGIRMATGARMANILQQFMTEAVVVSAIGGVIGVLAGLGAGWLIGMLGQPVAFSLPPVVLAFMSAFATGLVFGYMPARKAARLDPVVALGAE